MGQRRSLGVAVGNIALDAFAVGWIDQAFSAYDEAIRAGKRLADARADFWTSLRKALAAGGFPGGIYNTASNTPLFVDPIGANGWDIAKFIAGFFPVAGSLVSVWDALRVCGWL